MSKIHISLKSNFSLLKNETKAVNIWMRFIEEVTSAYKLGTMSLQDVRQAYEEALEQCSRHFTEASKLWESYRNFEQKLVCLHKFTCYKFPYLVID